MSIMNEFARAIVKEMVNATHEEVTKEETKTAEVVIKSLKATKGWNIQRKERNDIRSRCGKVTESTVSWEQRHTDADGFETSWYTVKVTYEELRERLDDIVYEFLKYLVRFQDRKRILTIPDETWRAMEYIRRGYEVSDKWYELVNRYIERINEFVAVMEETKKEMVKPETWSIQPSIIVGDVEKKKKK